VEPHISNFDCVLCLEKYIKQKAFYNTTYTWIGGVLLIGK